MTIWLPAWFTARFLWTLAAIALLLACSPGVTIFLPIAVVLGTVLLVAIVADAVIGPRPSSLRITRTPPEHCALGVTSRLEYTIENRSGRGLRVGIIETPARMLRFDADELIADAIPRGRTTVARSVTPISRGSDELRDLYVWFENSVGLIRRRLRVPAPQRIRIFPDLSAVQRYGKLHLRNRTIEAGLRRMRLRGAGTEFESLREWSDGDAFRSVDWKATARRGKLMIAQHEVERSQTVLLLLDCGRLMTPRIGGPHPTESDGGAQAHSAGALLNTTGPPMRKAHWGSQRKLDYAVTAALSLVTIAGLASDRVGVVAFAAQILAAAAPRSTRSSLAALSETLYDLEPRFEEANYARAFAYLRHHLHKRSLIVFLTDVVDPLAQATIMSEAASLAKRHVLICVFMNDSAVADALLREPQSVGDAYRGIVALGLSNERRLAKVKLERAGAIVIDVPAAKLTTALIDEYLRVKRRGLL